MPATASRAAFVSQEFRSVVWRDQAVFDQYGKVARDTGDTPIDTWFDNMQDVETMLEERKELTGKHARAFRVRIGELVDVDGQFALDDALPVAQVRDDDLAVDMAAVVANIESYDVANEQTTIAVWGVTSGG